MSLKVKEKHLKVSYLKQGEPLLKIGMTICFIDEHNIFNFLIYRYGKSTQPASNWRNEDPDLSQVPQRECYNSNFSNNSRVKSLKNESVLYDKSN